MFLTGVRVGEVGALTWDDIDFQNKKIHIRKSLHCSYVEGKKTMKFGMPKTTTSIREIPFYGEMEEVLKSQQKKQKRLRIELGDR